MLGKALLSHILDDSLTRRLGDQEARILVEWLVERAEQLDAEGMPEAALKAGVDRLRHRGRAIGRFVSLWCSGQCGAALQLTGAERFHWPLPPADVAPDDLMLGILDWESEHAAAA